MDSPSLTRRHNEAVRGYNKAVELALWDRCPEQILSILKRLGWSADRIRAYTAQMETPVISGR